MALPYVGSKITLISHSEIRYVGTLHEINKQDQTVTLVNVRSFGTEGRRSDLVIKPRPNPFAKIIFRGQDIKDLNVQQEPAAEDPNFEDPAIIAHEEAKPAPAPAPVAAPAPAPKKEVPPPKPAPTNKAAPTTQQSRKQQKKNKATKKASSLAEKKRAAAQARRKKREEEQKAKADAAAKAAANAPKLPEQKDSNNIAVKAPKSAEDWNSRTSGGRFHPTRLNHRWKQEQPSRRPGNGQYIGSRAVRVAQPPVQNIDLAATAAALEIKKQQFQQEMEAKQQDTGPKYNPNASFFDNLGSSTGGRAPTERRPNPGMCCGHYFEFGFIYVSKRTMTISFRFCCVGRRRATENALNRETFGVAPQQPARRSKPRRYTPQPIGNNRAAGGFYNRNLQQSHNRYGAHNRSGHHSYRRSQTQQQRRGNRY